MLGKFLELSIATPNVRASLDFYRQLGFSEAGVGEAWEHPYAVVTDGRLCLGLHQNPEFEPSVTFVKPDLLKHLEALELMGIEPGFRRLAGDVFNQIGWSDPSGHLIRLVEARTFSPVKRRVTEESLCGYFLEIAVPAPDRDLANSLRADLPDLVGKLRQTGFQAEAWRPAAATPPDGGRRSGSDGSPSQEHSPGNRRDGRQQPQQQQPKDQPRWDGEWKSTLDPAQESHT